MMKHSLVAGTNSPCTCELWPPGLVRTPMQHCSALQRHLAICRMSSTPSSTVPVTCELRLGASLQFTATLAVWEPQHDALGTQVLHWHHE
jgi:hypothetical protein